MPPSTLGVVLAGGLARRMGGGDKPLLRLGGRTLLEHVVERVAPQCSAGLVLSANGDPSRFAGFPGSTLADNVPDNPGPLAGILAGLDHAAEHNAARHRLLRPEQPTSPSLSLKDEVPVGRIGRVLSVSGDAPFLPHDLVARLLAAVEADDARIAVAASGERQHYTVALWPVALRYPMRAALENEQRGVGAFIANHGSVVVSWPSEPYDPFLNVNAPEDLASAQALLGHIAV